MDENPYEPSKTPVPLASDAPVTSDGKHCPACGVDIGIWPVATAVFPSRVRCPHCRSLLAYRGPWRITAVMMGITLVFVTFSAYLVLNVGLTATWQAVLVYLAITIPCGAALSIAMAVYLRASNVVSKAG
jgi:hypothetical protein